MKYKINIIFMETIKKIYKDSINIVFATNDNYTLILAVAIYSLIQHTSQDKNYDIIILETNLANENKKILADLAQNKENISIRFYNTQNIFNKTNFFHRSYYTKDTYSRLFIPDIMKEYNKTIYIDADTLILHNVEELYNTKLEDYLVAGCRNYNLINNFYYNQDIKKYYTESFPLKDIHKTINAGVLVMNLEKMRQINFSEQSIEILKICKHLLFQDEDILNYICTDKTKIISTIWNWRFAMPESFIKDYRFIKYCQEWSQGFFEQRIIHYITKIKPWDEPNMFYGEIWWHWAKKSPIYQQLLKRYFDKNPEKLK